MILVNDCGLYLALSIKSFKVKSKSPALICKLLHKRLMNGLMETIALPQDQEQLTASAGILSQRENERHNSSMCPEYCWNMGQEYARLYAAFSLAYCNIRINNADVWTDTWQERVFSWYDLNVQLPAVRSQCRHTGLSHHVAHCSVSHQPFSFHFRAPDGVLGGYS